MTKLTPVLALAASGALVVTALGSGATRDEGRKLSATLSARQEVPKPVGSVAAASGTFTGTLDDRTLKFKLTFKGLSGPGLAAHIHIGRPGKSGPVVVPLCGPCKSPVSRKITGLNEKAEKAIKNGRAYVNVHTAKNQAGEIRGQIKEKES